MGAIRTNRGMNLSTDQELMEGQDAIPYLLIAFLIII
jgi:hypothetical protein